MVWRTPYYGAKTGEYFLVQSSNDRDWGKCLGILLSTDTVNGSTIIPGIQLDWGNKYPRGRVAHGPFGYTDRKTVNYLDIRDEKITSWSISSDKVIYSMTIKLSKGQEFHIGVPGGTEHKVDIGNGDLVAVEGFAGKDDDGNDDDGHLNAVSLTFG